jgi:hypothetical protein
MDTTATRPRVPPATAAISGALHGDDPKARARAIHRIAAAAAGAGGRIQVAARLLGCSRRTLHAWIDAYPEVAALFPIRAKRGTDTLAV